MEHQDWEQYIVRCKVDKNNNNDKKYCNEFLYIYQEMYSIWLLAMDVIRNVLVFMYILYYKTVYM